MHPEDAARPCTACGYVEGDGCPPDYQCDCRVAKAAAIAAEKQQRENRIRDLKQQLRQLEAER